MGSVGKDDRRVDIFTKLSVCRKFYVLSFCVTEVVSYFILFNKIFYTNRTFNN